MNVSMRFSRSIVASSLCLMLFATVSAVAAQGRLKVTILGTGTPDPNPERFSAAILVEAGEKRFMVDCGRGTVVRLAEAGQDPARIDGVFITHLHYDHTVGLPDLWLTGWLLGRSQPFQVWGPEGTRSMAENLAKAFDADVQNRVSSAGLPAGGAQWAAHDTPAMARCIAMARFGFRLFL
jgi:ribonuclease Z